jgi:magnesium-transporting ATPase (P-type)
VWRERKNGVKEKERRKVVLVRVVVVVAFFFFCLSWVKDWKKTGNTQVSSVVWVTIVVLYVCVVCLCVLAKNTPLSILPLVRVFISFVFSHVCHTHTSKSSINKGLNIL